MNNICVIGEPFTLQISSPDAGESSLINIIAFNGQLVTQSIGTRDPGTNNVYNTTFTLDESSPIPLDEVNDLYLAELLNSSGDVIATKTFAVVSRAEPIAHSNDVLLVIGTPITDQLFTEKNYSDKNIHILIFNGNQTVVETTVEGTTEQYGKFFVTRYSINPEIYKATVGVGEYLIQATFGDETLYHPLHVLDAAGIATVHRMRMDIDKARLIDIDPTLNFSDSDLYHYLMMGIERFNMLGRIATMWGLPFLITNKFSWAVEKLGLIEALEAWSLAEGMKAFQFTGASIQLTVDRKKAIDDMLNGLKAKIPEIEKAKDTWIKQNMPMGFVMGELSSVSNGVFGPTCPPGITTKLYDGTQGYGW